MAHQRIIDVDLLRHLVEVQKVTQDEVEAVMGIPRKKVTKFCRRYGIQSQRTGPRSGAGHPEWKGGRILIGGYWYIYCPDHPNATKKHRVAEHRLVMEEKLGRFLLKSEVVHHIDGNSQNNDPSNLIVFQTNAEHLKAELTGKCPNWTPEGIKKLNKSGGRYANPKKLKPGESRQAHTTSH